MALTGDQKAMLRLLAQREQGYEDIAALMGLSVEEVRARVQAALDQLDEAGSGSAPPSPPRPVAAAESVSPSPPPIEPAASATQPAPTPQPTREASQSSPWRPPLPQDRRARWGLGAGLAAVLVLVVLLLTGTLSGGDGASEAAHTNSGGEAAQGEGGLPAGGAQPTQATLTAIGGGGASGRALFGRAGKNVILLAQAKGLAASPSGKSYAISLSRSPGERVPIAAAKVGASGRINGQFQVSPTVVGLLAGGFDEMEVSLVSNAELRTALTKANKAGQAPAYSGDDVLRGRVTGPFVNAAVKGNR